jgi:hypothetical protein
MQDFLNGEADPLTDPLIKSYYQATLNLARTIGIKSSMSADAQNDYIINSSLFAGDASVDPNTPSTWKYYLNLAGQLWPARSPSSIANGAATQAWYNGSANPPNSLGVTGDFYINTDTGNVQTCADGTWSQPVGNIAGSVGTNGNPNWFNSPTVPTSALGALHDFCFCTLNQSVYQNQSGGWTLIAKIYGDVPMFIASLDTLQLITFSKETLVTNANTAAEYAFGGRYYQTLVKQYPDQEDLIMGILMPCDINTAIAAENGTILRWDASLVEANEYSLIKNLEEVIKLHGSRWYVDAYKITDNLFLCSYYAVLAMFVVGKLFNLRHKVASQGPTYETHSFHVRMLLRGYMGLDRYWTFMTQSQAMWLYRNLPRLVKTIGYDSQFQELIANLLTPRNIQILGYAIQQTNTIDDTYAPTSVLNTEPLNSIGGSDNSQTVLPSLVIAQEETGLYGTQDYYDANEDAVLASIKNQDQAKVITKDLITAAQPVVQMYTMTQQDFALSLWGYMTSIDLYTATVNFINPRTGLQQSLSAKDAFVYMYYLTLSYMAQDLASDLEVGIAGSDLARIPNIVGLTNKRKITIAPFWLAQMHPNINPLITSNLTVVVEQNYLARVTPVAQQLLSEFVPLTACNSNDLFYRLVVNVYRNYLNQNALTDSFEDPIMRGYVKNMTYRCYQDSLCVLYSSNFTIAQFLAKFNLDSYETVTKDFVAALIANLYAAGTGTATVSSTDQKAVTQAMLAVMKALCSYNVQFIDTVTEVDLTLARVEPVAITGDFFDDGTTDSYITNYVKVPVGVDILNVTLTQSP